MTYNLGEGIIAFTTDRTIGRDAELVKSAVCAALQSGGNAAAGLTPDQLRFARPHQTHSDRVLPVAEEFFILPQSVQNMLMDGVDAVMTDVRGAVLGVSTADCIPVIIHDPEHHVAAAVHAGWRGTVQRIVMKTMERMRQMYHTDPVQCVAAIGPGISLESFEVGDEVYRAFVDAGFTMRSVARRYPLMHPVDDAAAAEERWHIDLKEINRQQLMTVGVEERSITVSDVDTYTDGRFFSARREQTGTEKCGRILTGFMLLP